MSNTTITAPPREELVRRAAELAPVLRKNAAWTEENRRLHEETMEALADAGLLRMRTPARYGGYESDTRTVNDVLVELGRVDAAVAWNVSVWCIPGWMVGMFPDEAQDEVYSTPNARVCGTLSPTGSATPASGGVVVSGRWHFISGALHSHWQEIIAMAPTPDGQSQMPVMALVPLTELEIIDDWHTSGLRGTGSITTVASDVFVPQHRVLPLPVVLEGQSVSARSAQIPMYRNPLVGVANASGVGMPLGLAKGAMDVFLDRLDGRGIAYTDYAHQREAPVTHLRVAEAALKIDQAEFHAYRITSLVDAKAATGEPWTLQERARTRADVGSACQLGRAAVDILSMASGGTSIYTSVPMQKIVRDIQAVTLHGINAPETNFELYGRILCGLEPNTPYI